MKRVYVMQAWNAIVRNRVARKIDRRLDLGQGPGQPRRSCSRVAQNLRKSSIDVSIKHETRNYREKLG